MLEMGKVTNHNKTQRRYAVTAAKRYRGNQQEGQGVADVHKRRAVAQYRHFLTKEKQKLGDWSDKLKKLYEEADTDDDLDKKVDQNKRQEGHVEKKDESISARSTTMGKKEQRNAHQQHNPNVKWQQVHRSTSSFHKEEKERLKKLEEQQKRRQEILLQTQAKEAAVEKRRQEKVRQHKLRSKRNYKGQPNMASRMELLLEKVVKRCQQP